MRDGHVTLRYLAVSRLIHKTIPSHVMMPVPNKALLIAIYLSLFIQR